LTLLADEGFSLIFEANGIMLRISKVEAHIPAPFTVLGWDIPDIVTEVDRLAARGIHFERFSGMEQDEKGICTFPDETRVAWFKDPDGNILSLTQFPGHSENRSPE
jgi:hypothetical protein